jgi:hypothetical protein
MKILLCCLSGLIWLSPASSQNIMKDSLARIQVRNVIDLYDHYTGNNAPVYNGAAYLYYTFRMHGNPFFESDNSSNGWLSYQGKIYDPLSIWYDVARNQIALLLPDSATRIVPDNEFVDSFNVAKHTFIRLTEDHRQNLYNTGFYDVLYNGHVKLLARRIKTRSEVIENDVIVRIFSPTDHFYIYKEGRYFLVNAQKDVFRLFADKTHEIRKMMRQQHIKLRRKNFESSLLKVTSFYDQLH